MEIYHITVSLDEGQKPFYDKFSVGLVIVDADEYAHLYIADEKIKILKPLMTKRRYDELVYLAENAKYCVTIDNKEKFISDLSYFSISSFNLEKTNWLNNFSESKFENKEEMYYFLFEHLIYKVTRLDKIKSIIYD